MVRAPKPHHLEGVGFHAEIVRGAEPDQQVDLSEGLDTLAWRNTVE
jgi:hypothetical protein